MMRYKVILMAALAPAALLLAIPSPVTAGGGGGGGHGGGGGGGGGGHGGGGGGGYGGGGRGGYGGGYGGRGYGGYGGYGGFGYGGFGYGLGGYGYGGYGGYGLGYGGAYPFLGAGYDYPTPTYVVGSNSVTYGTAPSVAYGTAPYMPPANTSLYYNPPAAVDNRAQVRVHLPSDAQLWFDGVPTTQTGPDREFQTPALSPGKDFVYDIKARWMQGGQPVERVIQIQVRANGTTSADFTTELPVPRSS